MARCTEEQTITPMFNDRGEISHFIGIKQDATERKRAEEEHIHALPCKRRMKRWPGPTA
jgi:hypothetical protein